MYDDHQPNMTALKREWLAARIVAVVGVVLLVGVLGVIAVDVISGDDAPLPSPPLATEVTPTPAPDNAEARQAEDIALCDAALATVQGQGLLPGFATRDGDVADQTTTQGRYTCHAKTTAAKYTIVFDLTCTRLGEAGCIVPYTVEQDGGGVLYQRP